MPAAADQAAISQASWIRPSRRLSSRLTSFWSGGRESTTERCFGRRGRDLTSRAITVRIVRGLGRKCVDCVYAYALACGGGSS